MPSTYWFAFLLLVDMVDHVYASRLSKELVSLFIIQRKSAGATLEPIEVFDGSLTIHRRSAAVRKMLYRVLGLKQVTIEFWDSFLGRQEEVVEVAKGDIQTDMLEDVGSMTDVRRT